MSAPGKPTPNGNSNILFVGNLPFTTPWQVIKDAFSEAGKVRYTDLIADRNGRPKGSALVTFSNVEGARRAVEMFNEKPFEGRRLIVRFFDDGPRPALVARDMQPSYARHAAAGKFRRAGGGGAVGGGGGGNNDEEDFDNGRSAQPAGGAPGPHRLEDEDEEADAEDAAFYRLQRQARAAVTHSGGAVLQDAPVSKRAARRAAAVAANAANAAPGGGGAFDDGRPQGYDARSGSGDQFYGGATPAAAAAAAAGPSHLPVPKPRSLQEASRRIFVSNLPFDCTAQALRDTFQQIGGVERAEIILGRNGKSRGMGVVILASEEEARLAISEFDGIEMAGRPMSVRLDNAQHQH